MIIRPHESMNNRAEKRRWRWSTYRRSRLGATSEEQRGWQWEKGYIYIYTCGEWRKRER
jgi:hypothetical protein